MFPEGRRIAGCYYSPLIVSWLRALPTYLFPFLQWYRQITHPDVFRRDLSAGVTVAIVAIPQSLAYAQLAGLPPHLGLYAAFVPTIVAALWGSCAQLSTGPVALTSLLVAASLASMSLGDNSVHVAYAVLLALMSGAVQLLAGALRLGAIVQRIPPAVITGFVNAAALMIALSQLPTLIGVAAPAQTTLPAVVAAVIGGLPTLHVSTAAFGLGALAVLLTARRIGPRFPAALLVLVVSILLSDRLGFGQSGGGIVGDLPAGLPLLTLPPWDPAAALRLLPAALIVAAVSFIEVTSSSTAISGKTGARWDADQELIGQGLAKIASGLFGSLPVSGSFSRSALNFASHARTGWASIFSALLVAVALLHATSVLHHLPKAVLAAVIILAVLNLFAPAQLIALWRSSRREALVAYTTLAATLASAPSIHYGVLIGLATSLALAAWRPARDRP